MTGQPRPPMPRVETVAHPDRSSAMRTTRTLLYTCLAASSVRVAQPAASAAARQV